MRYFERGLSKDIMKNKKCLKLVTSNSSGYNSLIIDVLRIT